MRPIPTVLVFLTLGLQAQQPGQDRAAVPVQRETIVVTGAFEPVPLEEADRAVAVHDVREQQPVANAWIDFLRLDPSLDLRQRAPNGVLSGLSIRGASFGQTLVLLDGLRMNDAQTSHFNLDLPAPLEAVSQLEVMKGTGSMLYGADAVGGVVNVTTAPPEASEFRLRTSLGNFGVNQQRGSLALVREKISQQLVFSRDFSSGFIDNRDYRNLTLSSTTRFETALGLSSLYLAHADKPFGADQFYCACNSWERVKTWFAGGRQDLGDRTWATFGYRRHTDLFVLYRDRPGEFTNRHALESWQTSIRRREDLGRNARLHYGAEGYRDAIESSNLGQRARHRGAGYVGLDVRALSRFSFTLGAREEFFGAGQTQFVPSASGGVWLNSGLKLKGSVSRGFRVPSFTELFYHDPFNLGSPDLAPEEAWGYEGSLDWNLRGLWRGSFTVFHRSERNNIDWVRRSLTEVARAANIQRLEFTGVEASAGATLARRHVVDFSYTALRGVQDSLGDLITRYTFNYPRQSGVVSWNASLPQDLIGRARVGVLDRRGRNPYTLVDVYLARVRGRVHPFVQLTNLLDTTYEEILGVPMPGLSVVGGLELLLFGTR